MTEQQNRKNQADIRGSSRKHLILSGVVGGILADDQSLPTVDNSLIAVNVDLGQWRRNGFCDLDPMESKPVQEGIVFCNMVTEKQMPTKREDNSESKIPLAPTVSMLR